VVRFVAPGRFRVVDPPTLARLTAGCPTWPIAFPRSLCITSETMRETEAHQYRLGSPLASIAGIAEATLQRNDLDDEVATRLRAIRDLALDALERAERPGQPDSGGGPQA
jgi:hypothetical protein